MCTLGKRGLLNCLMENGVLEESQPLPITKKARRGNASQSHRSTHEKKEVRGEAAPQPLPPIQDAGAVDVVAALRNLLLRMVAKL